jgi:8-oxo-dGTP pyrophosphatase MutT (NUDIX family)
MHTPQFDFSNTEQLLCDTALRRRITMNLQKFAIQSMPEAHNRAAAVALTIVDYAVGENVYGLTTAGLQDNAAALILTFRTSRLRNHAGQWALPGGRIDPGEMPEDTALREMQEEIGLKLTHQDVLGRLDDFATRSGYTITPVVVWGGRVASMQPNPHEVASIHRIPLAEMLRPDAPIIEDSGVPARPLLMMPVGESWIAAPTAALLYQFREVAIHGLSTRVAHFEQPAFAWR